MERVLFLLYYDDMMISSHQERVFFMSEKIGFLTYCSEDFRLALLQKAAELSSKDRKYSANDLVLEGLCHIQEKYQIKSSPHYEAKNKK